MTEQPNINNMPTIDYEKLATALAAKMAISPDKVLWTPELCANYLGTSLRNFVDRISKEYDFPVPIKIGSGKGSPRWYAQEVASWTALRRAG